MDSDKGRNEDSTFYVPPFEDDDEESIHTEYPLSPSYYPAAASPKNYFTKKIYKNNIPPKLNKETSSTFTESINPKNVPNKVISVVSKNKTIPVSSKQNSKTISVNKRKIECSTCENESQTETIENIQNKDKTKSINNSAIPGSRITDQSLGINNSAAPNSKITIKDGETIDVASSRNNTSSSRSIPGANSFQANTHNSNLIPIPKNNIAPIIIRPANKTEEKLSKISTITSSTYTSDSSHIPTLQPVVPKEESIMKKVQNFGFLANPIVSMIASPVHNKKNIDYPGAILVIDPLSGDDSKASRISGFWKTPLAAVNAALPGDSITLLPGNYSNLPLKPGCSYSGYGPVFVTSIITPSTEGLPIKVTGINFSPEKAPFIINSKIIFEKCGFDISLSAIVGGITGLDIETDCTFNFCSFDLKYLHRTSNINLFSLNKGKLEVLLSKVNIEIGASSSLNLISSANKKSEIVFINNKLNIIDVGESKVKIVNALTETKVIEKNNIVTLSSSSNNSSSYESIDKTSAIVSLTKNWVIKSKYEVLIRAISGNTQLLHNDKYILILPGTVSNITLPFVNVPSNDIGDGFWRGQKITIWNESDNFILFIPKGMVVQGAYKNLPQIKLNPGKYKLQNYRNIWLIR
jgi:hypothetical protein